MPRPLTCRFSVDDYDGKASAKLPPGLAQEHS